MAFSTIKLGSSLHGRHIVSLVDATAFVDQLDLAKQNLPHWQMARRHSASYIVRRRGSRLA